MTGGRKHLGGRGMPHRFMAVWTATHDNGWLTRVVENPDGSFSAWAAPDGDSVPVQSAADAEAGKLAADDALERETGHTECSARCTAWSLRSYAVFDGPRATRRPKQRRAVASRYPQTKAS